MATKIILPMLGQTMEEGTITKWVKQEGDKVEKGETLLEVMTDKANMEVESPESGILRKIIAQVDETIPIMAPIAIIGTADEPIDSLLAEVGSESAPTVPAEPDPASPATTQTVPPPSAVEVPASRVFISPRARRLADQSGVSIDALAGRGTGSEGRVTEKDVVAYIAELAETGKIRATPLASRIAAEEGISLREIVGTGAQGKIIREDVLQAVTPTPATSFPSMEAKVIPFTGIRKMVADNVAKSAQTAPHVTLTTEVDMTEVVKLRNAIVGECEKKYGSRLTYTDLVIKASALAILDHPIANATLQGNEIRIPGEINVGVAVALNGGLIVPVIRTADVKTVGQISQELRALVDKARGKGLAPYDFTGGTFSITNLGAYGINVFNPIITPGQSAILGVCRIVEKPVVRDGEVVVRSMMNLCLSFDHRVMDGAPAAQFLQRITQLLESPYQLLI